MKLLWTGLLLVLPGSAQAAFTPNLKPSLALRPRSGEIRIDGKLGDSGWQDAAMADNFAETNPGDQTEPAVATRVWITYDETHLYVGFDAEDDPRSIRASLRDRDQIWQDDYIGLILDTYGNAAWAYEIFANPLGVQGDLRMLSGGDEDLSFDVVFEAEASITDKGYQVEMKIPLQSLRFPDRFEQTWRVQLWRTHPRGSRRQYGWAAIDRDDPCFMCQFGTLTGIQGVRPGGKLELLPGFTAKQAGSLEDTSDPNSDFVEGDAEADVELGVHYSFTSSSTGDLTLNPDFSQVESDAGQIDVNTTFALFFPEKRPFFQEGSDLYETYINAVYTRTINDPSVAAKFTGRLEQANAGFFAARDVHSPTIIPLEEKSIVLPDVGESISSVGRYRFDHGENSFAGALGTYRVRDDGGWNGVFGFDLLQRFWRNYQFETQWLGSYTEEPVDSSLTAGNEGTFDGGRHTIEYDGESFGGRAGYTSIERSGRIWNFDLEYWETSPTFRADNGFISQNDNRRASVETGLNFRTDTRWFDSIFPSVMAARVWNFSGARKDEWLRPEVVVQFKAQTEVWLSRLWSEERFREVEFYGIRRWEVGAETRFQEYVQGGAEVEWGKMVARGETPPVLGDGVRFEAWGTLRPHTRLVIEPTFEYATLDHPDGSSIFDGYIVRVRNNFQFTREFFLRLVLQYDDFDREWSIEPLLTYRINPFTMFFVGSTHALAEIGDASQGGPVYTQTERQLFLKFQYLFRL